MKLLLYLKKAARITGPRAKHTSHSSMGNTLTILYGDKLPKFSDAFNFGTNLHAKFADTAAIINAKGLELLQLSTMIMKLNTHVVVKRLCLNSVREKKLFTSLNGKKITYILDVHQPHVKTGSDLKTTACSTLEEVVNSCRKYGYFRQATTYMKAADLKKFYFIFIMKLKPHRIFIVDVDDYPVDMAYAEQELAFTLYLDKSYGKFLETKVTEAIPYSTASEARKRVISKKVQ